MTISIIGLNKADVLAALYNASRPQGMGFLAYTPNPMGRAEAEALLAERAYFDYLKGRVMKVSLDSDESFDARLYDRDNGQGAAQSAVDALRVSGAEAVEIKAAHEVGKYTAAALAEKAMAEPSTFSDGVFNLGLADVAEPLSEAIKKAIAPDGGQR